MCNMEMETIWHIDKDITMETRKLLGESVEYAYTLCHLPTNELAGLPLRKKSRGVWQGDSSP